MFPSVGRLSEANSNTWSCGYWMTSMVVPHLRPAASVVPGVTTLEKRSQAEGSRRTVVCCSLRYRSTSAHPWPLQLMRHATAALVKIGTSVLIWALSAAMTTSAPSASWGLLALEARQQRRRQLKSSPHAKTIVQIWCTRTRTSVASRSTGHGGFRSIHNSAVSQKDKRPLRYWCGIFYNTQVPFITDMTLEYYSFHKNNIKERLRPPYDMPMDTEGRRKYSSKPFATRH